MLMAAPRFGKPQSEFGRRSRLSRVAHLLMVYHVIITDTNSSNST
jgi:hypothetical protein